jgi:hypothetical protein
MSRQPAKFKADDLIEYDELLESSSMSGLVSFLTDIPISSDSTRTEPADALGIPNIEGRPIGIPNDQHLSVTIPTDPRISSGIPDDFVPNTPPSETISSIGMPIKGRQSMGIPRMRLTELIAARHLRPTRTRIAQDGHSPNEQAIYEALWNAGKLIPDHHWKAVQIGYGELARRARVSRNSVIRLLASLERKMAIKLDGNTTQQGSCYTVYDFKTILESRERAGLFFAVRDRNAVHLLTEKEVLEAHQVFMGIPTKTTIGIPAHQDPTVGIPTGGIPSTPTKGIPGIPKELFLLNENGRREESTSALRAILQAKLPTFDDTAVEQLWADCRRQFPDVRPDEVGELFEWKLPESRARTIENPVGFLVRAVARSCTPAAIGALRQGRAEIQQSSGISREYWEQLLENPDATEAMRLFAREQLRLMNVTGDQM